MGTNLYLIAKIKTSKEEVELHKDIWLQKLKELNLDHCTNAYFQKLTGDWDYEFPMVYDPKTDTEVPDEETAELIYYGSPFVFSVYIYPECLLISTIYRYSFLYSFKNSYTDYFYEFRENVYNILNVFQAEKEIIYLADNCCDKLGKFLELQVWEGVSYEQVKLNMKAMEIPFVKDCYTLDVNTLNYRNITEFIYDDFEDILYFDQEMLQKQLDKIEPIWAKTSFVMDMLKGRRNKENIHQYGLQVLKIINEQNEPSLNFRYEYSKLSRLFIELKDFDTADKCYEKWLYPDTSAFIDDSLAYDFFNFLISKNLQDYLFDLFEDHRDLKSHFYHFHCAMIKFFKDESYKIYGESLDYYQKLRLEV